MAESATVITFVLPADVTLGLKSIESLRSYTLLVTVDSNLGICGVAIVVLFVVDSSGSMEYESTDEKPIPEDTLWSK